jgi:signal transduction histidine kinase
VTDIRFTYIFGPELYSRLLWFGRLRWVAVSGLALAAAVGPWLGFPSVWPSLFVVATVVAAYNVVYQSLLRRHRHRAHPYPNLRLFAICVMVLDLGALMVTVYFTGGLASPLLPFFAFHMAIGTIMIATRIMYLIAGMTSLGALGLYVLQARGILPAHPVGASTLDMGSAHELNLLTLVVALFGIVYLTDSVTGRFKQRNIELYRTGEMLRERTDELQRLLEQIERLEERKSHYMRISAHQLRSPVGTIKAALQVLVDGYVEPSTDRGQKLLRGAAERADGLLAIINDLLELAKIREGRGRKAPWNREINVNQLLADLVDSLQPYADERGVELLPEFAGVAILAWGLPPDLVHAFENLLYNALKYSDRGGRVTVRLRVGGETCVIRFIDEGIGIPSDYVDQVFFEFVRAPNAKRHAEEGTGLGLPIVKEVVEAHGGRITARSRVGAGTTFTIRLPLAHVPTEVEQLLHTGNKAGYSADTGAVESSRS